MFGKSCRPMLFSRTMLAGRYSRNVHANILGAIAPCQYFPDIHFELDWEGGMVGSKGVRGGFREA